MSDKLLYFFSFPELMEIYKPQNVLQPYIAMSYIVKGGRQPDGSKFNEMALPSGHCFMVFQHVGRFEIYNNVLKKVIDLPKMYLSGQQISSANMMSDDDYFEALVICLRPTAVWHITGIDVSTLVDEVIDLREAFKDCYSLFDPLFKKQMEPQVRITLYENILIELLKGRKFTPNIIDIAIDEILKVKGCIKIKDLTLRLNISVRYFRKKFKEIVGIPPSTYTRITRFNFLFSEMDSQNKNDFNTLSTFFGYYDISHFSRDFKKYCGESPRNFHIEKFKYFKDIWIDDPLILKID